MRTLAAVALFLLGCGAASSASNGFEPSDDAGDPGELADAAPAAEDAAPHDAGSHRLDADADAEAAAPLPPMPHQSFLVGYNQAWFGMAYASDLTTSFDLAYVRQTLDGINKAGGHIVRLWLFEGMQGVTLGQFAPQSKSVSPAMLANVDTVLTEARARGLWVYVTALNANDMPQASGPTRDFYYNLVNDKYGEGAAFQTNVLAPMLAVLDKHQDVVWGLDLVNEIAAARQRAFWPDLVNDARSFIQRIATFVHSKSPWLKVTSSAGWDGAQYDISGGFFSGLGLDFYDLHVYADSGTYDGASAVCTRAQQDGVPVILGELGQKTMSEDDALQQSATQTFLTNAKALCFKAGLPWRYDAAEATWNFVRKDGTFRPAVSVMQSFGSMP